MTLATLAPLVGEEAVLRRLLEIYAGIPAADLAEMPLDLSLRMGRQLAIQNQQHVYRWLFVAMKQRTVHGKIAGPGLRSLFKAFQHERLANPATQEFYETLVTDHLQANVDAFEHRGVLQSTEKDLNHALQDLKSFDDSFTNEMIWRMQAITKVLALTEYLLMHGTLQYVRDAEQMLGYGQLDIDLAPIFDDLAWLTARMRTAATFTQLDPKKAAVLRGWAARDRRFMLDLKWQA